MTMAKTAAELLGELDDYGRGLKRRKLLYTALPLLVIFGVYALMANAVVKRSAELSEKQASVASAAAELARAEADLAKRKQELGTVASDLAVLRGQYDELQKASDEARKKSQEVQETLEQPGNAAAKVEKLEELLTEKKPSARSEAIALWKQGYDAYNSGNAQGARALYQRALDKDPNYAAALNSLGRLAYDEGNLKLADEYFVKALAADPKYVAALHNRALVAKKQGRIAEASSLTNQALQIRPNYQPSMILKGDIDSARSQQTVQQTTKK
jgi:tetratricopeptide (TPR) repeat protein